MHERSSITDRRARPGGTCLSADPLTVDVQLGLMVTGSCVCVFVFARSCINIDFYIFFISLRRGRGGRLPRGGERHGTAGGAGARRGPDHPLRRHILLADPGHAVKKTHDGVKAGKPSRAETLGLLLWKDMRHKSSGPFEGRIQGRAPPPQRLCTVQEGRHRVREQRWAEARPQLLDLKAMFLSFQSYATSSCQKPSL